MCCEHSRVSWCIKISLHFSGMYVQQCNYGSYGKSIFSFERIAKYFPECLYQITFLPKNMSGPVSPQNCIHCNHSGRCDVSLQCYCNDGYWYWILLVFISHPCVFFSEMSMHLFVYYPVRFIFSLEFWGFFLYLRCKKFLRCVTQEHCLLVIMLLSISLLMTPSLSSVFPLMSYVFGDGSKNPFPILVS